MPLALILHFETSREWAARQAERLFLAVSFSMRDIQLTLALKKEAPIIENKKDASVLRYVHCQKYSKLSINIQCEGNFLLYCHLEGSYSVGVDTFQILSKIYKVVPC